MKIDFDKKLHFAISLLIALIISLLAVLMAVKFDSGSKAVGAAIAYATALAITMIIGVVKELRDNGQPGNHFCMDDLTADMAGALIGSCGAFLVYMI